MTNIQAIDLLKGLEQSIDDYWKTAFRMAITALESFGISEQLPSAQPEKRTEERTETHACDCIERQAAIKALKDATFDFEACKIVLEQLPPIQPVVRCKDCKHFEYDHPYIIQGIPVLGHEVCNAWGDGCKTDENGYCFMAERRTDEGD